MHSAIDPELLEFLADPESGQALEVVSGAPINPRTGHPIPIRNGIPSFLPKGASPVRHHLWRRFYDATAFAYDATISLGHRIGLGAEPAIRRGVLGALGLPARARILELGAGTGANRPYLPHEAIYLGLDISMAMLRRAQERLLREQLTGHFIHADASLPPLNPGRFDLVFSMGLLQHLSAPHEALITMARAAVPAGLILVLDEAGSLRSLRRRIPRAGAAQDFTGLAEVLRPPRTRLQDATQGLGDYYMLCYRNWD